MQSSTDFITHQNIWITMIRMNKSLHRHLSPTPLQSPAKVRILLKFETWLNGSFLWRAFCWTARRNAKFTLFNGLPPFLTGEKKKKAPNICGAKAGRIKAEQKEWVTVSETCFQPGLCQPACFLVFALTAGCVVSLRRCLRFNQIMSHGRTFTSGWRGNVRPYFTPGGRGCLRWGGGLWADVIHSKTGTELHIR